jgi:hypothetical protein
VKWPERNDCVLMTSKGFSSRAARDFIDYLAETGEECEFYFMHDADSAGTMIYQTLQEATKARAARRVKIINLGLEPDEAREMGLPIERVKRQNPKEHPVADYVPYNDKLWLRHNRVELNAMTTRQFLEWLNRKFAQYGGKVIPPEEVLRTQLEQNARRELTERFTEAALRRARIAERVEQAMLRRADAIATAVESLPDQVCRYLERHRVDPWTTPIEKIARKLAKGPTQK